MWYCYTISIKKVLKNGQSKIDGVLMEAYNGWDSFL